jgi:hypothetical protein
MLVNECSSGTIQKPFVWKMSKRKSTYKYALILIFWKCLDSKEFNCIVLFVVSLTFVWFSCVEQPPYKILAKFTHPV